MRHLIASLLVSALFVTSPSFAQNNGPFVKVVAKIGTVGGGLQTTLKHVCPTGWLPVGYSFKTKHAGKVVESGTTVIDNGGNAIDIATLTAASRLFGAGYAMTVTNTNPSAAEDFELMVMCFSPAVFTNGQTTVQRQSTMVPPGRSANIVQFCPENLQAVGAVNDGGQSGMINQGTGMMWGSALVPQFLGNQTDGLTGPATGWEGTTYNTTATAKTYAQVMYCGSLPQAQTYIYSVTADTGLSSQADGGSAPDKSGADSTNGKIIAQYPTLRVDWGAAPDITRVVAYGYDAFYLYSLMYDYSYYWDSWTADNIVTGQLLYYYNPDPNGSTYESTTQVYGISGRFEPWGLKSARVPSATIPNATARIVFGMTVLPTTAVPPAPTVVTVIEFYNQTLDHYFITANLKEISDLDTGVHVGWVRTGESFKAYGTGSSGHTRRHPVCRAYGNPSAKLDSHFYSANMEECYETLSRFNDAWLLEASEVFQMDLPDPTSGACPAGDVPVYRLWNNREDSNHRYTTSIATRDQMLAKNYIAEGYGPDNVTLCALQ